MFYLAKVESDTGYYHALIDSMSWYALASTALTDEECEQLVEDFCYFIESKGYIDDEGNEKEWQPSIPMTAINKSLQILAAVAIPDFEQGNATIDTFLASSPENVECNAINK